MILLYILIALVIWCALSVVAAVAITGAIDAADAGNVRADTQSHKGEMQHD